MGLQQENSAKVPSSKERTPICSEGSFLADHTRWNLGSKQSVLPYGVNNFPSSSSSSPVKPNTFWPLRVLLLCTAAIQRIEAPGLHSRLAIITPNKKQIQTYGPTWWSPQSQGRKCCISNFPSGLEAPVSLLVFHLSRFYCVTSDRDADSCLYCVSIYFLSTQRSLQPYVPHHVAETHSWTKSLNLLALNCNHKRWSYTAAIRITYCLLIQCLQKNMRLNKTMNVNGWNN